MFIRLFDLAGYFGIVPKYIPLNHPVDTHAGRLMYLTMSVISIAVQPTVTSFNYAYSGLLTFVTGLILHSSFHRSKDEVQ